MIYDEIANNTTVSIDFSKVKKRNVNVTIVTNNGRKLHGQPMIRNNLKKHIKK